ncbi:hypothetical protein ACRQ4B_16385 [Curtobacterium sp. SP.BCo]|uniref:hypothetical protein n=1 Tax=Curtobacterium sp. SP.BCo TaxID=3435229 RepID=UPI003F73E1B1
MRKGRTALGCLGALAVPAAIIAVAMVVGASTRDHDVGATQSGMLTRDADATLEITYRSTAEATESQAARWGDNPITRRNEPSHGTPYVIVADVAVRGSGRVTEDDLRFFSMGAQHGRDRSGPDIEPTGDAEPVDGCVTTASALVDALGRDRRATTCTLVRMERTPEVITAGTLYRRESVRRTTVTNISTARWKVGPISPWRGSVR